MKLINKKTGQEGNFIINKDHFECVDLDYVPEYRTLAELNAEWGDDEDSEEDGLDNIIALVEAYSDHDSAMYPKEIVEKLKAWRRLRDRGVVLDSFEGAESCEIRYRNHYRITFSVRCDSYWLYSSHPVEKDLHLLFSGGED